MVKVPIPHFKLASVNTNTIVHAMMWFNVWNSTLITPFINIKFNSLQFPTQPTTYYPNVLFYFRRKTTITIKKVISIIRKKGEAGDWNDDAFSLDQDAMRCYRKITVFQIL